MVDTMDAIPTQPKGFGQELRRLRENAGVSIEDLIAETKVSRRILEALENGKFQYLPERVFSRNFVKQYAQFVGTDVARVVEAFDGAWDTFLVTSGSHPAILIPDPPPISPIRWRFWVPVILTALILIVVASFMVRGSKPDDRLAPDPRRFSNQVPTPTTFPAALVSSPAPTAEGESDPQVIVESEVEVRIEVDAGQECWVKYRDREGEMDSRLLAGGATMAIRLAGPATLSLGNAGAVSLTVGGKVYDDLGTAGQVIHCQVSNSGLVKLGA